MTKKNITTLNELLELNLINPADLPDLKKVADTFSISITDEVHQLIDKNNLNNDPIAKQFIPTTQELTIAKEEISDPVGDNKHKTVKGIVHRYPDRCLLTPVHVCPIYCRFCFRREKVGNGEETLTPEELKEAIHYIKNHQEIWEVILTGGDPLILKPSMLKKILHELTQIPHVAVIRIHTRIPIVESRRINAEMLAALKTNKALYIAIHANHPKEFTENAINACNQLTAAGIPLLSQTVLLKGINDNIETLSTLMRTFVQHRIKPYYLHHGDLVKGTSHFRTDIAQGLQLMRELHGRFSGLCQPTYVIDIPGGYGKVPVGHAYLAEHQHGYIIEDYLGRKHAYNKQLRERQTSSIILPD